MLVGRISRKFEKCNSIIFGQFTSPLTKIKRNTGKSEREPDDVEIFIRQNSKGSNLSASELPKGTKKIKGMR